MPRYAVTTGQLISAIVAERQAFGTATVRGLAGRLGISVGAAHNAVRRAVDEGVVEQSEAGGSIRLTTAGGDTVKVDVTFVIDRESKRVLDVRLA